MNEELSPEEKEEFEQYGSVRSDIETFCRRRGSKGATKKKRLEKTVLGTYLGVDRVQVNNYMNADRLIEFFPDTGVINIVQTESVVNEGVFGVVKPKKKKKKARKSPAKKAKA